MATQNNGYFMRSTHDTHPNSRTSVETKWVQIQKQTDAASRPVTPACGYIGLFVSDRMTRSRDRCAHTRTARTFEGSVRLLRCDDGLCTQRAGPHVWRWESELIAAHLVVRLVLVYHGRRLHLCDVLPAHFMICSNEPLPSPVPAAFPVLMTGHVAEVLQFNTNMLTARLDYVRVPPAAVNCSTVRNVTCTVMPANSRPWMAAFAAAAPDTSTNATYACSAQDYLRWCSDIRVSLCLRRLCSQAQADTQKRVIAQPFNARILCQVDSMHGMRHKPPTNATHGTTTTWTVATEEAATMQKPYESPPQQKVHHTLP